jgi:hypothetical protein
MHVDGASNFNRHAARLWKTRLALGLSVTLYYLFHPLHPQITKMTAHWGGGGGGGMFAFLFAKKTHKKKK